MATDGDKRGRTPRVSICSNETVKSHAPIIALTNTALAHESSGWNVGSNSVATRTHGAKCRPTNHIDNPNDGSIFDGAAPS